MANRPDKLTVFSPRTAARVKADLARGFRDNRQHQGQGGVSGQIPELVKVYSAVEDSVGDLQLHRCKVVKLVAADGTWKEFPEAEDDWGWATDANGGELVDGKRYAALRYGEYEGRDVFVTGAAVPTTDVRIEVVMNADSQEVWEVTYESGVEISRQFLYVVCPCDICYCYWCDVSTPHTWRVVLDGFASDGEGSPQYIERLNGTCYLRWVHGCTWEADVGPLSPSDPGHYKLLLYPEDDTWYLSLIDPDGTVVLWWGYAAWHCCGDNENESFDSDLTDVTFPESVVINPYGPCGYPCHNRYWYACTYCPTGTYYAWTVTLPGCEEGDPDRVLTLTATDTPCVWSGVICRSLDEAGVVNEGESWVGELVLSAGGWTLTVTAWWGNASQRVGIWTSAEYQCLSQNTLTLATDDGYCTRIPSSITLTPITSEAALTLAPDSAQGQIVVNKLPRRVWLQARWHHAGITHQPCWCEDTLTNQPIQLDYSDETGGWHGTVDFPGENHPEWGTLPASTHNATMYWNINGRLCVELFDSYVDTANPVVDGSCITFVKYSSGNGPCTIAGQAWNETMILLRFNPVPSE